MFVVRKVAFIIGITNSTHLQQKD